MRLACALMILGVESGGVNVFCYIEEILKVNKITHFLENINHVGK